MIAKSPVYLMASRWTFHIFLLGFISYTHAQSPGFFLEEWQEKTAEIPEAVGAEKPAGDPSLIVTVDLSQLMNRVPHYIYGNNAVTWDNGLRSNATGMQDLKNLKPNVLRWPGGSLSNSFFWNVPKGNRPADIPPDISPWFGMNTDSWQMSVDAYYDLLEKTNSTGSICVNYGYARYGTGPNPVATAAHMAAEWVRYDNGRTKFWELGNENYGDWETSWEIDPALNQDGQPRFISGQLYGQQCRVFIDSMRSAASEVGAEIKIGAVAYDAETSHNQVYEDWNEGMMPEIGDLVDFIIVHSYFTPHNQNSTAGAILNSHVVPGEIMMAIESDMAEAGKPMIPVAMTEWNIFAVGSMQQVSYINGMLAAIALGEYVKNNYGMANRWDLVNGWNDGNDHGMFSKGGEPGVDLYNPRAVFFYMYYHQNYFGDRMVQAALSGNNDVVAHASTFSSGETGIVLVNKSVKNEVVQIDLQNGPYGLNYYWHTLTGGTDNGDFSRKVLINGIETDEEGGGPDGYKEIRANSAMTRQGIRVDLPPLSVAYVMVEDAPPLSYVYSVIDTSSRAIRVEVSEDLQPISDYSGLEVLVNGSNTPEIISVKRDSVHPDIFHILLGSDLVKEDGITISYSGSGISSLDGTVLAPFTNETVDNLIPGGPYWVTLVQRAGNTGLPLEDCQVIFNDESIFSDDLGRAIFEVFEGGYNLQALKVHFDTTFLEDIQILSDTTIYVDLEQTIYEVDFQLSDAVSGENLGYVGIALDSLIIETDAGGMGSYMLPTGTYQVMFSKQNYHVTDLDLVIESDTAIDVQLQLSHVRLKFRLKNGQTPIHDALVVLGNDSLYTNQIGTCLFESVLLNTSVDYQIEREHYFKLEGNLSVGSDTTLDLQLERSVARIEFLVSTPSGPGLNTHVILGQDTICCNKNGQALFYNIPIYHEYAYTVESENHTSLSGSLFLENDTTVHLLFTIIEGLVKDPETDLRIYPNPTAGVVHIESKYESIKRIELIDAMGKIIYRNDFLTANEKTKIQLNIEPGIYFLIIHTTSSGKSYRIIVS